MSYEGFEESTSLSYPIELYEFDLAGTVYRYTSADHDIQIFTLTYKAVPIERGTYESNQDMARSPLTLEMSKDVDFLKLYYGSPPTDIMKVTVKRFHEGDGNQVTIWIGRLVNVKFSEREAHIQCESIYTSMRRPVLRRRYQIACPHVLYSEDTCKVTRALHEVSSTVVGAVARNLTVSGIAGYAAEHFTGGFITWQNASLLERRFITKHTGAILTLNLPFDSIPVGDGVKIYPGCNHTTSACHSKFNNLDNYGGQPYYPAKNPMNGTSIF